MNDLHAIRSFVNSAFGEAFTTGQCTTLGLSLRNVCTTCRGRLNSAYHSRTAQGTDGYSALQTTDRNSCYMASSRNANDSVSLLVVEERQLGKLQRKISLYAILF